MKRLLSRIRYFQFNSVLARRILLLYYRDGKVYRIPFGPLRGQRIRYHPSTNFHVMLGMWELKNLAILSHVVQTMNVATVADVGANIGFMTLWFAKMIKSSDIYAFEPAPTIAAYLKDNLTLNHATNVTVVEKACADTIGKLDFYIGFHHHASSLNRKWAQGTGAAAEKITVAATTLDHFFYEENHALPDLIKMDIEGGGIFALKGCQRLLTEKRPLLLIESHTPDEDRAISNVMVNYDYVCYRVSNDAWVTQPREVHPHPDGVWGTMLLCPAAVKSQIEQAIHS